MSGEGAELKIPASYAQLRRAREARAAGPRWAPLGPAPRGVTSARGEVTPGAPRAVLAFLAGVAASRRGGPAGTPACPPGS